MQHFAEMLRPTVDDALRTARATFLAPARVDMSALADELGINRVTLYRWIGSRDKLLVDVVWALADEGLSIAGRRAGGRGADRVVTVIATFIELAIANPGMRRWLNEEGEHAMRLLTRREDGFQPRLIAAVRDLLEAEAVDLPADLDDVAFVLVRLVESYVYMDLLTGEQPDAARAEPILRMLLR